MSSSGSAGSQLFQADTHLDDPRHPALCRGPDRLLESAHGPHGSQHAPGVFWRFGTCGQEASTPSDPEVAGWLRAGGAGLGTSLGV